MDKVFSTRMDEDLIKKINQFVKDKSMSKKGLIEKALRAYLEDGGSKIEFDISPQIDAFKAHHPHDDLRRLGSKMVRERSALLYYYADMYKAVVLGTANKSEILLGYFTKWGDPAADLLPLAELYKTHVLQLAQALEVPTQVIEKPPSAGMWPGQKDEESGIVPVRAGPLRRAGGVIVAQAMAGRPREACSSWIFHQWRRSCHPPSMPSRHRG